MKNIIFFTLVLSFSQPNIGVSQSKDNLMDLSKQFLSALQNGESTEDCKRILSTISLKELADQINNDDIRKAFWINIYNAYIQDILQSNPELYEDRGSFFKAKQMNIAGRDVSFDDIEHGIIRRSVSKLSLGYLSKIFVSKFERKLRTDKRDPRIHFALNCGAKSCPPVAIFDAERIDEQLDAISKQYLANNSTYDLDKKTAYVPALMSWFRGDFGGLDGAKDMLRKYNIVNAENFSLEFNEYDWTLDLGNYTTI